MPPTQQHIDCPNPRCATPAQLGLCTRFAVGLGLQIGEGGTRGVRWDDTHCLVCGHYESPYAKGGRQGRDLHDDAAWLAALDRALRLARRGRLPTYLASNELGLPDLLAMRQGVLRLGTIADLRTAERSFPHIGLLRVPAAELPDTFGVAHGEAESEDFARKVRVLGRLLGASSAETSPRHCSLGEQGVAWFFYGGLEFIGLLSLQPNRGYRGAMTIDGCLTRLLHAS